MDETFNTTLENLYTKITEQPIDNFVPRSNFIKLMEMIGVSKLKELGNDIKKELEYCLFENMKHSFITDINDIYQGILSSSTIREQLQYSQKSVIKELFQNIFDCEYNKTPEITVELKDECRAISFKFNEVGFSIYDIYWYLGIGNGEKKQTHTGRFGIGAKFGIFLNCKKTLVESCNSVNVFKLCVSRSDDRKKISLDEIEAIKVTTKTESYTKIELHFGEDDNVIYNDIRNNILTMHDKKGDYFNIFEMVFASVKLQERLHQSLHESKGVYIKIIGKHNRVNYVIFVYKSKYAVEIIKDDQLFLGLLYYLKKYENEYFIYLLPNLRNENAKDLPQIITKEKYAFFSTFELTDTDKKSGMLVSVPSIIVAPNRKKLISDDEIKRQLKKTKMEILSQDIGDFVRLVFQGQNKSNLYIDLKNLLPTYSYTYLYRTIGDYWGKDSNADWFKNIISIKIQEKFYSLSDCYRISNTADLNIIAESTNKDESKQIITFKIGNSRKRQKNCVKYEMVEINYTIFTKGNTETFRFELGRDYYDEEIYFLKNMIETLDVYDNTEAYKKNIIKKQLANIVVNDIYDIIDIVKKSEKIENCMFHYDTENSIFYIEDFIFHCSNITVLIDGLCEFEKIIANEDIAMKFMDFDQGSVERNSFVDFLCSKLDTTSIKLEAVVALINKYPDKLKKDSNVNCIVVFDKHIVKIPKLFNGQKIINLYTNMWKLTNPMLFKDLLLGLSIDNDLFYKNNTTILSEKECIKHLANGDLSNKIVSERYRRLSVVRGKDFTSGSKFICFKDDICVDIAFNISDLDMYKTEKLLILTNQQNNTISGYIERWITGKDKKILDKLFNKVQTIILDQFPYIYKNIHPLDDDEWEFLRDFVMKNRYNLKRELYQQDINSKLFGYGNCCSIIYHDIIFRNDSKCCFMNTISEAFSIVNIEYKETILPVYVCKNDEFSLSTWLVQNISIDGKDLEKLFKDDDAIIRNSTLLANITYDLKVTALGLDIYHDSSQYTAAIRLTPLMLMVWYCKYIKII